MPQSSKIWMERKGGWCLAVLAFGGVSGGGGQGSLPLIAGRLRSCLAGGALC